MKKLSFLILISLLLGLQAPAEADNANPPKIISIEQVTKGPYSVGDIVTFKVNYTGGFPGIESIKIGVRCLNNNHSIEGTLNSEIGWVNTEKNNSFSGNGLVSGYVLPCNETEVQPGGVTITDQTRLTARLPWEELKQISNLKLQINKSDLLPFPVGEIKPPKVPDEVDLGLPSKIGLNQSFNLPRTTKAGSPLFYRVMSRKNCQIEWDTFLGDLGGKLTATSVGICTIRIGNWKSDKYENPSFKTDKIIKPSKSSMVMLNFNVVKSGKK